MKVAVAAGVLRRPDGRVLIAQRPQGKMAAGRWEFPGGKIEAGESPRQALGRELQEELGVTPTRARPLIRIRHAYTDRLVELDTWLIEGWDGLPCGLESQALAWVHPENIWDYDLLEADAPIVHALRLPSELPVTGAFADDRELRARLVGVLERGHKLLRLRAPALDLAAYRRCVERMAPLLQDAGASLLVDRAELPLDLPGIRGLHLRAAELRHFDRRPVATGYWLMASCHDATELALAVKLGVDALVLGSLAPTPSHPGVSGLGWAGFKSLVESINCPVYAIGGVHAGDLEQAFAHGAQGVAGISAYW